MKRYWKAGVLFVAALSMAVGVRAITSYIAASAETAHMQILVSSQEPNGLTPNDFNMDFLRTLQAYISEDTKHKTRASMRRQGVSPAKVDAELDRISSQAAYMKGERKLAAIRIQAPGWNSVAIVGLVNGKLTRIDCTRSSPEMIASSDGLCGEKIHEVFDSEVP